MLKFKPFDPESKKSRHPRPTRMRPGDTIIRNKPLPRATRIYLCLDLKACTRKGMQFSVAEDSKYFAIRRDK